MIIKITEAGYSEVYVAHLASFTPNHTLREVASHFVTCLDADVKIFPPLGKPASNSSHFSTHLDQHF